MTIKNITRMRVLALNSLFVMLLAGCDTVPFNNNNPAILPDLAPKQAGPLQDTIFDRPSAIERELTELLNAQTEAWNEGSIEGFMEYFWQSPKLRFVSGDTIVKGWKSLLTQYKERYPDRTMMGRLSYRGLEIEQLSENSAFVSGQWSLFREIDAPWGHFTMILRRFDEGWFIISDTTTFGGV